MKTNEWKGERREIGRKKKVQKEKWCGSIATWVCISLFIYPYKPYIKYRHWLDMMSTSAISRQRARLPCTLLYYRALKKISTLHLIFEKFQRIYYSLPHVPHGWRTEMNPAGL